jgi:selenocysteine lyase/cysteine desulfurase
MDDLSLLEFRRHFPEAEGRVHLASCSKGPLSDVVEAAALQYLRSWRELGAPWELWSAAWEESRARMAGRLGVLSSQVALAPSASSALGWILASRPAGSKMVIDARSFPSALHLGDAQRARCQVIYSEDLPGDDDDQRLAEAVARTGPGDLLTLPEVCFRTGALLDLAGAVAEVHARGGAVLLDGYQACGVVPSQVAELGVDGYVTGSHKYLLGSEGLAFLYWKDRDLAPSSPGWMAAADPQAMAKPRRLAEGARRFEQGTPTVSACYAFNAADQLLSALDPQLLSAHCRELVRGLREACSELGLLTLTPPGREAAMLAVASPDPQRACQELAGAGLIASPRGGAVRFAFHGLHTAGDLDRLRSWLSAHPSLFEVRRAA